MAIYFDIFHLNAKIRHLNGEVVHNVFVFIIQNLNFFEKVCDHNHTNAVHRNNEYADLLLSQLHMSEWNRHKLFLARDHYDIFVMHLPTFNFVQTALSKSFINFE